MQSYFGRTATYTYGMLLVIIFGVVIIFMLCDFGVMNENQCTKFNSVVNYLSEKIGQ